jgi:hypothetical protein
MSDPAEFKLRNEKAGRISGAIALTINNHYRAAFLILNMIVMKYLHEIFIFGQENIYENFKIKSNYG